MQESDNVQHTPSQTVTELTSAEQQWVWDCKPLAPDSWGNFLAFVDYRGDGTIELRRFVDVTGEAKAQSLQDMFRLGPEFAAKALEISTQLQASAVNDTPEVRYRPANLTSASRFDPRFWRDGGTRLCYVPTADDAEFVQALFPGQPNPKGGYNPNWRAVREELVVAGISPTRLVEMSPRELLLLVQKGRSPATGAGKPDLSGSFGSNPTGIGQGDESAIHDEPLAERAQTMLVAMLERNLFDSDHRQSTAEIAVKAFGDVADSNALKRVMANLKACNLIASKQGRGGGFWLTKDGKKRAEKLKNRSLK